MLSQKLHWLRANQNINQAHSTEEVKRAKGDGINSINDIHAKVNKNNLLLMN